MAIQKTMKPAKIDGLSWELPNWNEIHARAFLARGKVFELEEDAGIADDLARAILEALTDV